MADSEPMTDAQKGKLALLMREYEDASMVGNLYGVRERRDEVRQQICDLLGPYDATVWLLSQP